MRISGLRTFQIDSRGGVALMFGLVIPSLIGFTGLGVDASYWLMERQRLQSTTDSAAVSVARALQLDGANAPLTAEAKKLYEKVYAANDPALTYTVQYPPQSGSAKGDLSSVAVVAERKQPIYFLKLFGMQNVKVKSQATAKIQNMSEACVLALAPSTDKAVEITGSANANINCGIASNSNSASSIYLFGNATVNTTGISTVGDVQTSNAMNMTNPAAPVLTHSQPLTDPYGPQGRNLQVPATPTACTGTNTIIKSNTTLQPGRYCGGITMQKGTTTLQPGVYILDGDFSANAQASIVGTGVTIVLTSPAGCHAANATFAKLNINGAASVDLKAPVSGATKGVLFFQDPEAPTYQGNNIISNTLNGGASLKLSGAMYFPSQELKFSGGAGSNISCLQMVGHKVTFTGNSAITSTCTAASGTERMARSSVELIE